MTSIKCAYVVWLSIQIMFCGFHLAIFSLIVFISLLSFYSFLSTVMIWLSFSLWCLIVFSHMLCHITLRWIGAISPAGGWQIEKNKSDIWAKLDFLSTNNKYTQKWRRKGEINKDSTKIGGILNRRFWQLGQAWFPLTLKTREQKKGQKLRTGTI